MFVVADKIYKFAMLNAFYIKIMKNIYKIVACVAVLFLFSCTAQRNVPYMVEAETIPAEVLAQMPSVAEPIVMPGDLLNIEVSATNMSAVAPFNKGRYVDMNGEVKGYSQTNMTGKISAEASTQFYLVSKDGCIDFPILGKLHVGGMNKAAIETLIQDELCPKYLKETPSVDIRFMNFRVTVFGAVKMPGTVIAENERMNIFEALARSGDLDIKGRRDNVKLIRTNADGSRQVVVLNLNSKDILMSPYYNLQQNDMIYVEPNKSMAQNAWQINPAVGAAITIIGGLSSIASLIIGIVSLSR